MSGTKEKHIRRVEAKREERDEKGKYEGRGGQKGRGKGKAKRRDFNRAFTRVCLDTGIAHEPLYSMIPIGIFKDVKRLVLVKCSVWTIKTNS